MPFIVFLLSLILIGAFALSGGGSVSTGSLSSAFGVIKGSESSIGGVEDDSSSSPTPAVVKGVIKLLPGSNTKNAKTQQLETFTIITQTPTPTSSPAPTPLVLPTPTSTVSCGSSDSNRNNCSCSLPASDAVMCNVATNSPSAVRVGPYTYNSTQTCPDGGIPCSLWSSSGPLASKNYLIAQWGECKPDDCIYIKNNLLINGNTYATANPYYTQYINCDAAHSICWDKPVIYLYSDRVLNNVSVMLDLPGIVTTSIPVYPSAGWQNLTVKPGGKIDYERREYTELYYESSVTKNIVPQTGYVFLTSDLPKMLDNLLTQLGLKASEKEEFFSYWLPKLYALHKPYIFVGILTPEEKESVDKVIIKPEPDTTIAFLAYFKGLSIAYFPIPPVLSSPPLRKGFTMVEWGGQIATN